MAQFGIQATNISETPSATTAKKEPVNPAGATLVEAAGKAAIYEADIRSDRKALEFKKEGEDIIRSTLGFESPEAKTKEEKDFEGTLRKIDQMQKLGSVDKALLKLETAYRSAANRSPWMADKYQKVYNSLKGDYGQTLRLIDAAEKSAAASATESEKYRQKVVQRLTENALQFGVELDFDPNTAPIEQLIEAEREVNLVAASTAAQKHRWELEDRAATARREERQIAAMERSNALLAMSIEDQRWQREDRARDEANETVLATTATAFQARTIGRIQQILNSPEPAEVKQAQIRDAAPIILSQFESALRTTRDGKPTLLPESDIQLALNNMRKQIEDYQALYTGDSSDVAINEAAVRNLTANANLNVANSAPAIFTLAKAAPALVQSPWFSGLLRSTTLGEDQNLSLQVGQEMRGIFAGKMFSGEKDAAKLGAAQATLTGQPDKIPLGTKPLAAGIAAMGIEESYKPRSGSAIETEKNPLLFGNLLATQAATIDVVNTLDRNRIYNSILNPQFDSKFSAIPADRKPEYALAAETILDAAKGDYLQGKNMAGIAFDADANKFVRDPSVAPTAESLSALNTLNLFVQKYQMIDKAKGGNGDVDYIATKFNLVTEDTSASTSD